MEPNIYFVKESPDFNYMIEEGRIGRIAANRVVMCIMTEFGLCNDRRMNIPEFSRFVETTQMVTGTLNEKKEDVKERYYRKKKSVIAAIESMRSNTPVEPIMGETPAEGTA